MIQIEPSLYYMLFRDLIEDDDNHPFGGYVYISDDDLKEIAILWRLRNSFIDPVTEDPIIPEADLLELDREFLTEHSAEKIPKRSVRLEFNYWLNDPNAGSIPPYSYARNLLGSQRPRPSAIWKTGSGLIKRFSRIIIRSITTICLNAKIIKTKDPAKVTVTISGRSTELTASPAHRQTAPTPTPRRLLRRKETEL